MATSIAALGRPEQGYFAIAQAFWQGARIRLNAFRQFE